MRTLSLCLFLLLAAAALPTRAEVLTLPALEPVAELGVVPVPGPACGVGEIGFEVLPLAGSRISLLEPGGPDFVIRNRRQWCEFWRFAHSGLENPPACDRFLVDFRNELVIATTTWGGTGCYGITVERIQQHPGSRDVTVFVSDISPGRDCLCTASFVRPLQAVVVAAPIGRVEFVHEPTVVDWQPVTVA